MWTYEEINEVIGKTNQYINDVFYDKMEFRDCAILNMFVMLLLENIREKQEEKND